MRRCRPSERLKLWGAAGYGTGEVTLKTAMGGSYKADTMWSMAAAGLRGDLLEAPTEGSGPALAMTSDALWTRTSSEKTRDLAASQSDVTRLRLGLEGSWRMALDGGDAGAAPGRASCRSSNWARATTAATPRPAQGSSSAAGSSGPTPRSALTLDVSGRTLIAHEDGDLEGPGLRRRARLRPAPRDRAWSFLQPAPGTSADRPRAGSMRCSSPRRSTNALAPRRPAAGRRRPRTGSPPSAGAGPRAPMPGSALPRRTRLHARLAVDAGRGRASPLLRPEGDAPGERRGSPRACARVRGEREVVSAQAS